MGGKIRKKWEESRKEFVTVREGLSYITYVEEGKGRDIPKPFGAVTCIRAAIGRIEKTLKITVSCRIVWLLLMMRSASYYKTSRPRT